MFENIPFALNYKNIVLKSRKCIVDSRSECDITTEIAGKKINCPVFPSNMPAIVDIELCSVFDYNGWFHVFPRLGGIDSQKKYIARTNAENWNFVSPSIGIKEEDDEFLDFIISSKFRVDVITIDLAHSWTDRLIPFVKKIKEEIGCYLIVGNGDSPHWINWLENLGCDYAKMFIGVSKGACRTREFTGFSSSTITDLVKCKHAANKIKIIADGGLTIGSDGDIWTGDVAKSIRFGADYVMSGSLFSQCSDSPAQLTGYFGNSTSMAKGHYDFVEGTVTKVKDSGLTIAAKMKRIEQSLKSSVSYAGGRDLSALKTVEYQVIL